MSETILYQKSELQVKIVLTKSFATGQSCPNLQFSPVKTLNKEGKSSVPLSSSSGTLKSMSLNKKGSKKSESVLLSADGT